MPPSDHFEHFFSPTVSDMSESSAVVSHSVVPAYQWPQAVQKGLIMFRRDHKRICAGHMSKQLADLNKSKKKNKTSYGIQLSFRPQIVHFRENSVSYSNLPIPFASK